MAINNYVHIAGFLVFEPDVKTSPKGTTIVNARVAVPRNYDKEKTDYIDCVFFGKCGENFVKFFSKGSAVNLDGEIITNPYTNKHGDKVTQYQVKVANWGFPIKNKDAVQLQESSNENDDFEIIDEDDFDSPF